MAAEAAWIISGDDSVQGISPYSKAIAKFSDDGERFFGAYGPKIKDQLPYVISCFQKDLFTRQAVVNIWRENPAPSKDIPCTLTVQFLIRNNALNCMLSMRSSDAWLGWPYDLFNFSMLSWYLLQQLGKIDDSFKKIRLGHLQLRAGSQHLYEENWEAVSNLIRENSYDLVDEYLCPYVIDSHSGLEKEYHEYDVLEYLNKVKNGDFSIDGFLNQLFIERYGV